MKSPDSLLWLALFLLCAGLPFGVAVQTATSALAFAFAMLAWKGHYRLLWASLFPAERGSVLGICTTLLLCGIATLLNPKNPEREVVSFLLGFAPFFCLPLFFARHPLQNGEKQRRLELMLAIGMAIWAVVAFSQLQLGWKLDGSQVRWGDHFKRAQGFYSHPLTLAYVGLLLWVPSLGYALHRRKSVPAWVITAGVAFLLYASASRMAQLVAGGLGVMLVMMSFRGMVRWLVLAALGGGLFVLLNTQNMLSERFVASRSKAPPDRESPYIDDRVAFWLAHLEAVKERPLLGHGVHLGSAYRRDYYAQIGLPDIKKAYEAHNQILQLAFEGGVFAALSFLIWLWMLHKSWSDLNPWYRRLRDLSLVGFFLGGLTQNAFYDSEVRYTLGLIMVLAFAVSRSSGLQARST